MKISTEENICSAISIWGGICTPPVGVCLFAATNIGETKLTGVIKELVPFVVSNIIVLLLVTFVPAITVGFSTLIMGAG